MCERERQRETHTLPHSIADTLWAYLGSHTLTEQHTTPGINMGSVCDVYVWRKDGCFENLTLLKQHTHEHTRSSLIQMVCADYTQEAEAYRSSYSLSLSPTHTRAHTHTHTPDLYASKLDKIHFANQTVIGVFFLLLWTETG